ncbi:hypothetical protein GW17_00046390 [Ensete ventricosum]|nr:hypothetical protein GW17_00046390 [Ensete ventricosum]
MSSRRVAPYELNLVLLCSTEELIRKKVLSDIDAVQRHKGTMLAVAKGEKGAMVSGIDDQSRDSSQGPCTGLPQAVDCNRGGSSRAGKQPPCAVEVVQAMTSHATGGSPRLPTVTYQWPVACRPPRRPQPRVGGRAGRSRVLATAQAATTTVRN